MKLESGAGIALYYQLKEKLKEKIKNGVWTIGDQIPNEMDLMAQYQVSRTTVRQAVLDLVREGILIRKKGKGTFIAEPKYEADFTVNFCYPREFGNRHELVSAAAIPASDTTCEQLCLAQGETVYNIVRLRYFHEEAVAIETLLIPERLFPGLLQLDLRERIFDLLAQHYGIQILKFNSTVEPVILTTKEAKLFGLDERKAALMIQRVCVDVEEKAYMLSKGIFRGDRCKLFFKPS